MLEIKIYKYFFILKYMKLPSSYDIIGDILIFELKDKLTEKEETEIANELLKINKNVKVVAKRVGIYKGVYRTRKIKILAGENRKETVHKENDVKIKLDVEKCYFSPRTSQERLRVANLVKNNESVLTMFSGVAPFPLTIARKSKAKEIYSIEINPIAHKYALENVRINKFSNINLIQGDVNKKLIYNDNIGLKTSWNKDQLKKIVDENPKLIELHLFNDDLELHKEEIEKTISELSHINFMIHCPPRFDGKYIGLSNKNSDPTIEIYKELGNLCKRHKNLIGFIAHVDNQENPNKNIMIKNIKKLKSFYKYMYIENSTLTIFKYPKEILEVIKATKVKNFCVDLTHFYMALKNTDEIVDFIKEAKKHCNLYFHISDSTGIHNPGPIGSGKLDFKKLYPLIDFGIYELIEKDYINHPIQLKCYRDNKKFFLKKFDRIIMPLPKESNKYLDLALKYLKDKGTIHLYMFANENEFNLLKKEYSKRFNVKLTKCGAYAPRIFRVCLDLKRKL